VSLPQSTLGKVFLYALVLIAVVAVVYSFFGRSDDESRQDIPLSDLIERARNGDVTSIEVRGDKLTATMRNGQEFDSRKESDTGIIEVLQTSGVKVGGADGVEVRVEGRGLGGWAGVIISFLPLILFGGIIVFFMTRMNRRRSE
jgi:cell division protease FtsH